MRTIVLPVSPRHLLRAALLSLAAAVALGGSGCQLYRSIGKGQNMDTERPRPHHEVQHGGQEIIAEVTTDAEGKVASINLRKSSGREAVDNYVVESIRSGWPPVPSTRSIVRLRHLSDGGFSDPETISNTPVQ